MCSSRSLSSLDVKFTVNRLKLSWFSQVCRHDTLPQIILEQWIVGVAEEGIKEWTGQSMLPFLRIADDRSRSAVITAEASVIVP